MGSRVFLDTNIVLDFIILNRKNSHLAKRVLSRIMKLDYEIFISEDIISTTYYIAKNHKKETIKFFIEALNFWHIIPFGKNVLRNSFEFSLKYNTDLEDTLQCFCAKENGCFLLTNDKKFIDCGVEIVTYEKFLDNYD